MSEVPRSRLERFGWPLLWLTAGLCVAHYPMITSGFARTEAELGDTRLLHYLLEHSWRWLTRDALHLELWSPPFFAPAKNVGAYSEIFLGAVPPYAVLRAIGVGMDNAFQGWLLATGALTFVTCFLLVRRTFDAHPLAASVGAALVAFSAPRLAQAGHYQLYPQYWSFAALLAAHVALSAERALHRRVAVVAFFVCAAAQFWAGFYLGYFFAMFGGLLAVFALATKSGRAAAWALVRRDGLAVLGGAALAGLMLWPYAQAYLEATREHGGRTFEEVRSMVPRLYVWLYHGDASWLYSTFSQRPTFSAIPMEHELRLGIGFATLIAAVVGFVRWRKHLVLWLALLVASLLLLLASKVGETTAWKFVFEYAPGGKAIRAVARIVLVTSVPVLVAAGLALEPLLADGRWRLPRLALAVSIGAFFLLEQGQGLRSYDKASNRAAVNTIAQAVDRTRCDAFLLTVTNPSRHEWKYHLDAMWASLEANVPTVNGYSGWYPAGYPLQYVLLYGPGHEPRINAALSYWATQRRLDPSRTCWVRLPVPEVQTFDDAPHKRH